MSMLQPAIIENAPEQDPHKPYAQVTQKSDDLLEEMLA